MVTEAIFNVFDILIKFIISLMPKIDIALPEVATNVIATIFSGIGYFLPVMALMPILIYNIIYLNARIIWALVLRIKSFIPTMGG